MCKPCVVNGDCSDAKNGATALGVCDTGTCVQCTGLDSATAQDFCLLPTTTTCTGLKDTVNWDGMGGGARPCGTDSTVCGVAALNDGVCGTNTKCSYGCSTDNDCPTVFPTCPTSGTKYCQ
ncbi:MAG TPA: hypothetical protein VF331_19185 [Polyangiales bacterium]